MFYLAGPKDNFWYASNALEKEKLNIIFINKDNVVYYKDGDCFVRRI